jgi:hypothetical protein
MSLALILLLSCTDNKISNNLLEDGGSYDCIIEASVQEKDKEPVYYEQCGFFTLTDGAFNFNWDQYSGLENPRCQIHMNEYGGKYSTNETIRLYSVWSTKVGFPNEYPIGGEYDYRIKHSPLFDSLIMWQTKTIHRETGGGDFDITYEATIRLKKLAD